MLLLELPDRPDIDVSGLPALPIPILEIEVRRDEGPDVSAPVVEIEILGEAGRSPEGELE